MSTAADGTPIDDWIEIHANGRVTVKTGKVELGTGLMTALAQIAAEELDVAVEDIDMAGPWTGRSPDEGYTAGSRSIKDGGAAIRRAAAEARQALLELATAQLGDALTVARGVITGPGGRRSYAELMGGKPFHRTIDGRAPLKHPESYSVVGTAVRRADIARKVNGLDGFVTDIRVEGMVHARVVRPRTFGARLVDVDTSALPDGVIVVRRNDFLAVVADREEVALAARAAIRPLWTDGHPLPPMDDLFGWMRRQVTDDSDLVSWPRSGDVAAGQRTIVRDYHWPFQAHASLAPSCAVADVRPDGAVVYTAAQGVYPLQRALAQLLDLPPASIEVIHREGSGCYGHNGADDAAADAAVISQELGRPVRVQWTRFDELVWARKGPAMTTRMTAELAPKGRIAFWSADIWTPTHGGRPARPDQLIAGRLRDGLAEPEATAYIGGGRNAQVDYDIAAQRVTMRWLRKPALPGSALRGLGATANTFANECFMDELAALAEVDPVEFRRRHLTDPRALAVLDAVTQACGWGLPLPAGRGRGFAYGRYDGTGAYVATVAEVSIVDNEARVERLWIAHDCGLIVNPDGLRNQIEGNLIQSLSRALIEQVRWDAGGLLCTEWDSYPILRFTQIPPLEVILIDRPDQPPVGAGEPATITTAPAVANAIAAASGVRLRQVPLGGQLR
ncbi:aldehyde dehydrogenase [Rhizocola hellebori]|uniref:Aldehyde dehydrogenase n=1 Tax=Rhizocola hellebori TaxID=1392758 RepID=A0A8J3Q5J2_9ACTN|nr:molybdopterin cofactor-binding domain-containing protein [Rhizocola hellebori]GIH03697.1 aldehyde dehydrogenase [Rhizocola hellebori]